MDTVRSRIVQLVVAMLAVAFGQPALASVTIDIGSATAAPSGSVQVPIAMAGATGGAGGAQVDVLFPQAELTVSDPSTACVPSSGVPGAVSAAMVVPGRLRLILWNDTGAHYNDGTLMTCTFAVASDAAAGAYSVTGTGLVVSSTTGGNLGATLEPGTVTVCTGCCP